MPACMPVHRRYVNIAALSLVALLFLALVGSVLLASRRLLARLRPLNRTFGLGAFLLVVSGRRSGMLTATAWQ